MNCPICGAHMEEGGLIIDGVAPGWVPHGSIQEKGRQTAALYGPAHDRQDQYPVGADKGAGRIFLQKLQ